MVTLSRRLGDICMVTLMSSLVEVYMGRLG